MPRLRGQKSEDLVAQRLEQKGFRIVARNQRWLGVEVDLIVAKNDEVHLIEIKTLTHFNFLERRVTPFQRERMRRVLRSRLERGEKARAHLALVMPQGVCFLADFFVEGSGKGRSRRS